MNEMCSVGDRLHLENIGVYITKRIMNRVISRSIRELMSKKIIFFHVKDIKCIWVVEDERENEGEISVQELVERVMKEKMRGKEEKKIGEGPRIYLKKK